MEINSNTPNLDKLDDNQCQPLHRTGHSVFHFIFRKRLMHKTETYLPQDLIEVHSDTPKRKPKLKKRIIEEFSEEDDEDEDSHIDYETPKALRRKVPVSLSGDRSDYVGTKKDDSNIRNNESGNVLGDDDHKHKKKASKQDQTEKIDLRKVQKSMTGSKDKRAFRKEVEERREVVAKDKKVR